MDDETIAVQKSIAQWNDFRDTYWHNNENSELSYIITGHLYTEGIINDILDIIFPKSHLLNSLGSITFETKVTILESTGLLPQKHAKMIKALNKLRNKMAHELNYIAEQNEVDNLCPDTIGFKTSGRLAQIGGSIAYIAGVLNSLEYRLAKMRKENKKIL